MIWPSPGIGGGPEGTSPLFSRRVTPRSPSRCCSAESPHGSPRRRSWKYLVWRFERSQSLSHVLVAPPGEAENVEALLARVLQQPGDRVRGLERRDDALEAGELLEGAQRLLVGDPDVGGAAAVAEVGVLGPDAGVIEAGGDRSGLEDPQPPV